MGKIFTGDVISYTQQVNVLRRDQARPAGDALAGDRRGHHLAAASAIVFGRAQRDARRAGSLDRALTVLALIGVSTPVFFLGAMMLYFLGYKCSDLPARRLRAADRQPVAVVLRT